MRKFLLAALLAAPLLAACNEDTVVVPQFTSLEVPERYLQCVGIKKEDLPDWKKLTDKQVAELLARYDVALRRCQINMDAVKKYVELSRQQPQK